MRKLLSNEKNSLFQNMPHLRSVSPNVHSIVLVVEVITFLDCLPIELYGGMMKESITHDESPKTK